MPPISSSKLYRALSSSRSPKLVIFLIDESESMREPCGVEPKHMVVDRHVNLALRTVINLCTMVDGIKDRMSVAVLGYGGMDEDKPEIVTLFDAGTEGFDQLDWILPLSKIQALPVAAVDGVKQFVRSQPRGWTPMAMAVKLAGTVIHDWVRERLSIEEQRSGKPVESNRFPLPAPVIMNVTDGIPSDDEKDWGPIEQWAERLDAGACYPAGTDGQPIALIDGPPLLINVGTPATSAPDGLPTLILPTESELPADEGVARLWRLASPLHPNLLETAIAKGLLPDKTSHVGRRLYVNAGPDAAVLDKIFQFGSGEAPR